MADCRRSRNPAHHRTHPLFPDFEAAPHGAPQNHLVDYHRTIPPYRVDNKEDLRSGEQPKRRKNGRTAEHKTNRKKRCKIRKIKEGKPWEMIHRALAKTAPARSHVGGREDKSFAQIADEFIAAYNRAEKEQKRRMRRTA